MSIASLGVDFGVLNVFNLWVACVAPANAGHAQLVDFVFYEERPDLGEIEQTSRKPFAEVPASVANVILPWTNYDRSESLSYWRGWLEGSNLCAVASSFTPPVRVPIEPLARLVRPALAVSSGEFEVPFVSAGGKQLALVRFLPERPGSAPSGAVLWKTSLAQEPIATRAALGPEKSGSLRRIVLLYQEKEGVALEVLDLATGRPLPGVPRVLIPKMVAISGAEPGLRIDDQGATHVALLVASRPDGLELSTVDVVFMPGRDAPPEMKIEAARKVVAPPVAAGIAFQSRPDRPMRRDWAALLADGSVIHSLSNEKPMRPQGLPVTPLDLMVSSQSTYILTVNPLGPLLEPLR